MERGYLLLHQPAGAGSYCIMVDGRLLIKSILADWYQTGRNYGALADRMQYDYSSVWRVIHGDRVPTRYWITLFAYASGCGVFNWLMLMGSFGYALTDRAFDRIACVVVAQSDDIPPAMAAEMLSGYAVREPDDAMHNVPVWFVGDTYYQGEG